MIVVSAREQSVEASVALTSDQVASLIGSSAVAVTPAAGGSDAWDLRTAQYVGIVRGPDLEIRIRPKVPVRNLLFLLGYATGDGWHDVPLDVREEDDVVPAVAAALAYHADRALARGVLQGYRQEEDALFTLRGRLREGAQLRRRFAFPVPVEVAWDEYTVDIAENQLLKSAAAVLLRTGGLRPRPRARLLHLLYRLEGVSELRVGSDLPPVRFTRLNAHYRNAVGIAEVVLTNRSTDLAAGRRAGLSFLFDMNRVFEDFLTAALTDALVARGGTVVSQHRATLDVRGAVDVRPDLTWWDDGRCRAAIDAKYKSVVTNEAPNADVYQMLAYCTALDLSTGWLVYAAGNEAEAAHHVRNTHVGIRIATIDLGGRPAEVLASVDALAERIAVSASPPSASAALAGA